MKNLCINYHRVIGQLSLTTDEFSIHARRMCRCKKGENWWRIDIYDEASWETEEFGYVMGLTPTETPRAVWHAAWHLARWYNRNPEEHRI